MDFTKRVMRGFVFVSSAALPDDAALGRWLDLALAFNPQAKRSARKKTKRALKAWTRSRFEFAIQRAYHSLRQYPGPIPCS